MLIGKLASLTGASPKAIRLYESLGLLKNVQRHGTYRRYTPTHLQQVQLIRQAQGLGFTLADLKDALSSADGEPDWRSLIRHLQLKQASIRQDIQRMSRQVEQLDRAMAEIRACLAQQADLDASPCRFPAAYPPRSRT